MSPPWKSSTLRIICISLWRAAILRQLSKKSSGPCTLLLPEKSSSSCSNPARPPPKVFQLVPHPQVSTYLRARPEKN
ncbi:hypothetical protein BYT27DRAFT_7204330 [Phlegmacium glaucopus]|nr:hypothetical protein BYT27DRAFT_7204330 [Phlegmacium glaucopus]